MATGANSRVTTVLKLGGELLDSPAAVAAAAAAIVELAADGPLVVVHGGGRAIDAELVMRGQAPRFVDGLRVTDQSALDAVVAVLAGRNNTALVAALGAAGARAVGLTGAGAGIGRATKAGAFTSVAGMTVDLGLVGEPAESDPALLVDLLRLGYVPVVASVGVDQAGSLLNVNADTLAGHLAATLGAARLIIGGGTAGVLDAYGATIDLLNEDAIEAMSASGAAHSGMLAKLAACRRALSAGVAQVAIVGGRDGHYATAGGTRIERAACRA